jgi:hypothetical protein
MGLNINRLTVAKKRAKLEARVEFAKRNIALMRDTQLPALAKAAQAWGAMAAFRAHVDAINSQTPDPFDVLDVTQMGSGGPSVLTVSIQCDEEMT